MSEIKIHPTLIVERGNYFFGMTCHKNDGTTESRPPRWITDPEGSAVIVCLYDTEKNETIGEADLFAWWDICNIDKCITEKLALSRRNFPTPEELYRWVKEWDGRNLDLCEICEGVSAGYDCKVCPIYHIRDD